jgi:hypothetical protein
MGGRSILSGTVGSGGYRAGGGRDLHHPSTSFRIRASGAASARSPRRRVINCRSPRRISTRSWDTARAESDRFVDAPAARRICEHLRLPWGKVLDLAFLNGHAQRVALGHALSGEEADWLTDAHSRFVLKLIARRLGASTLSPGQYRAERHRMVGAGCSRRRGNCQLPVPSAEQIEAVAGTWDAALAGADLVRRHGVGGHRAHVGPTPIVDVLDRCYEHHGVEPTLGELVLFARANGIPFPRKERGRPYSSYVEEWKDARTARGLTVPDGPHPKSERPDYSRDVGAVLPGERRAKSTWAERDELVGWVMRYLGELKPRKRSSQRGYDAWARRQGGAPWASVVHRHGSWAALREEAWKRLYSLVYDLWLWTRTTNRWLELRWWTCSRRRSSVPVTGMVL